MQMIQFQLGIRWLRHCDAKIAWILRLRFRLLLFVVDVIGRGEGRLQAPIVRGIHSYGVILRAVNYKGSRQYLEPFVADVRRPVAAIPYQLPAGLQEIRIT